MNKSLKYFFLTPIAMLFVLIIMSSSCQMGTRQKTTQDLVNEWLGKEIKFPAKTECAVLGDYAPCKITVPKPYKILLYTDSTGCTSCKLRLDLWKYLINEADTTLTGKVDFAFYFYPKNMEVIRDLMKRESFERQVYIDRSNEIQTLNSFSDNMDFQCFLLDKDNKVVFVGNPSVNAEVWRLEKKIILGEPLK